MGSPCLFTRQRALKMGYFYWLRVKNSNHLHTEFSLGNLKDTKFYFEIRASFIKINSIASCYLFLIAWLWGFCTFSGSSVESRRAAPQASQPLSKASARTFNSTTRRPQSGNPLQTSGWRTFFLFFLFFETRRGSCPPICGILITNKKLSLCKSGPFLFFSR